MSFAVIVIDMLNTYEHEDAELLKPAAAEAVPAIARLVRDAHAREALVVYVNDNFSDWTAGRHALTERALSGAAPELVRPIAPPDDLPFLVKARHSAFYDTQLEYLLHEAGVQRVLLAGQVTEQCILYSALDAYVRHFDITIARDCVAHIDPELAEASFRMMETNMRAHVHDRGEEALDSAAEAVAA